MNTEHMWYTHLHSHAKNNMGSLTVITGTMFSGKTKELMRLVERARIAGHSYLIFKPVTDVRSPKGAIRTNGGATEDAIELSPSSSEEIFSYLEDKEKETGNKVRLVAIDEGNFFPRNSGIEDVTHKLANEGYRVVVAGLDLDYMGRPFGAMPDLLALADEVVQLYAVCMDCGDDEARFPFRTVDAEEQIVVGGTESYRALCRDCYLRASRERGRQVSLESQTQDALH